MNQYAIFQIPFENDNIRNMYFMSAEEIQEISDQYEFVAAIKADNLDDVFRIGNFVYEDDAQYRAVIGQMRSISVGDIIQNVVTNETFVVANYGFEKIDGMKEAV
jgi:hypothetical protein